MKSDSVLGESLTHHVTHGWIIIGSWMDHGPIRCIELLNAILAIASTMVVQCKAHIEVLFKMNSSTHAWHHSMIIAIGTSTYRLQRQTLSRLLGL